MFVYEQHDNRNTTVRRCAEGKRPRYDMITTTDFIINNGLSARCAKSLAVLTGMCSLSIMFLYELGIAATPGLLT